MPVQNPNYELRSYRERQSVYKPVGRNAAAADAECKRQQKQRSVIAAAREAGVVVMDAPERKTLAASAQEYIADCQLRGASEAALQARQVCDEFRLVARKSFLDEIGRDEVLRFHAVLRKRGMAPRTIANKHERLRSWFIFEGMDRDWMPPTPSYEKSLPNVYTPAQVAAILASADDYLRVAISLALMTGLREQEFMHLEWSDIDVAAKVLRVRGKAKFNFKVKDKEQRDLPLPPKLLKLLIKWHKKCGGRTLVLGSDDDKPMRHTLRLLKQLARRSKLNCGSCRGCRDHQMCQEWNLHRFRRTYCTRILDKVGLRTAQAFMGHSDLASTMRYLSPASAAETQDKMAAIDW